MKESDGKGVANRTGPEPCAVVRKDGGEASAGVRAGWVLNRENMARGASRGDFGVLTSLGRDGRQHRACRYREARPDPARSETPRMHGINSHGNREIPSLAVGWVRQSAS